MAGLFLIDQMGKLTALAQEPYDTEDLLQGLLADYPDLLGGDQMGESPRRWLFVAREAPVPDQEGASGRWSLDHLFLDQDAVPTFVEVKRASDTRIRREVVGQMLDYAANGLLYWPIEMIQGLLAQDGLSADDRLEQSFGPGVDTGAYWQRLKENIAQGRVRLLFVADRIPAELMAVVEFLNRQMDRTEVLAIEIPQFVGRGLRTLAPRVLGKTQESEQRKGRVRRTASPEFQAVVDAFDAVAVDGLVTSGRAAGYRQVKIAGWPNCLHYEFLEHGSNVGIEIHLEAAGYPSVRDCIEEFGSVVAQEFPSTKFADKWFSGCRLITLVPMTDAHTAAETMNRVVAVTHHALQNALESGDAG